jgi:hypothetical protein
MDVNLNNNVAAAASNAPPPQSNSQTAVPVKEETKKDDPAASFEKSDKVRYKPDRAEIQRIIDESNEQVRSFVEMMQKMMIRQANAAALSESDMISQLLGALGGDSSKHGVLSFNISKADAERLAANADPEVVKWAQEQISENGYWGVEQTSERLFSFAKALTGGDPSKIQLMRDAIDKGFEAAERQWGDKLPEISQKTYEATMKKIDEWAAGAKV